MRNMLLSTRANEHDVSGQEHVIPEKKSVRTDVDGRGGRQASTGDGTNECGPTM